MHRQALDGLHEAHGSEILRSCDGLDAGGTQCRAGNSVEFTIGISLGESCHHTRGVFVARPFSSRDEQSRQTRTPRSDLPMKSSSCAISGT